MVLETRSPEETYNVGKKLGEHAIPGQVFTLTGDLGVGKTVFTQGLASGLGIEEPVNSPTFTIVQVYEEGRLPFYHFAIALHLRSYRYMRKGDFLSIILTCTGSVMWRRWRKSGLRTTLWERGSL